MGFRAWGFGGFGVLRSWLGFWGWGFGFGSWGLGFRPLFFFFFGGGGDLHSCTRVPEEGSKYQISAPAPTLGLILLVLEYWGLGNEVPYIIPSRAMYRGITTQFLHSLARTSKHKALGP